MRPPFKRLSPGLSALWLVAGWLLAAGLAAPAGAADAPPSRAGLSLSGFKLSHPGSAQLATRLVASFELKNTGAKPVRLGSKFGAFVAARWSTRSHRKLNRDFGHQARDARLAPGAVLKVRAELILDMPGDWSLWPAVEVGEEIIAFEEAATELKVRFGEEAGPTPVQAEPARPEQGGQTVVQWDNQLLPLQVFPPDNPWNVDISRVRRHPMSEQWIATMGPEIGLRPGFGSGSRGKAFNAGSDLPFGTPYVVVRKDQAPAQIKFEQANQSDAGDYPIPKNPPTEGSGYEHIIVLQYDENKLYEVYKAEPIGPLWYATAGAIFDLTSNRSRAPGYIAASGSGLPIFPGLVRWEEVTQRKRIDHALSFTTGKVQAAYMLPATHAVGDSKNPAWPPLGMRVRLRRDFDVSGFPANVQVILEALKTYGMFLIDQGKDWNLCGAPDEHWDDTELDTLKNVRGHDFEVVDTGVLIQ